MTFFKAFLILAFIIQLMVILTIVKRLLINLITFVKFKDEQKIKNKINSQNDPLILPLLIKKPER